jgi:restriction endonuclease Mrr
VPKQLYADLDERLQQSKDSVGRHEIARTVLTRLNARGDAMLRQRREVLKRVVEVEDFSSCWENDRLPAQGLVAQIRSLVNAKDSFTRMKEEREAELRRHREAQANEARSAEAHAQQRAQIKADLYALFAVANAHRRGTALEGVLNRLFDFSGMLVREAFTRSGPSGEGIIEQVDGVIDLEGELHLVEMKWWNHPLGPGEVAQHLTRVFGRADCRGVVISASSFTPAAVQTVRDALHLRMVFLCDLQEIVHVLDNELDLRILFKRKTEAAIVQKEPLYRPFT